MLLTAAILFGIQLIVQIPQVGPLLIMMLIPSITAGYLSGCHVLQQGMQLQPKHLFAGFREHMPALVVLSGVNFGIQLLLHSAIQSKQTETIILGLTIGLLMVMAMHFAPALILFGRASVLSALQISLFACLKNFWPLLVYGLLMFGLLFALFIFATTLLPMGLIIGVMVWIPVFMAGTYAAFRSIFPQATEMAHD